MRMVPNVSGKEIEALVRERLVEEVVVKTDGWQGYSFLAASPRRHEWIVPGSGKEAAKVKAFMEPLINRDPDRFSLAQAQELYSLLLGQALKEVKENEGVIIVPDGRRPRS